MEYIDIILDNFPIDIDSTSPLQLDGLQPRTKLYSVDPDKSPLITSTDARLYIIDTTAGKEIACHPHIVSQRLADLCVESANEFVLILKQLDLISDHSGIMHILRGSSGYMVNKALPELPVIHIRTKYSQDGYRSHSDDSRRIDVIFSDYHEAKFDTLIIPDTYATGRSVEATLIHMFKEGFSVETVIIYGFTAIPAIERVQHVLDSHGVELHVFSICDITQLYSNNYDMPLYGLDEYAYQKTGELYPLGSIVSESTLHEMLPRFIPGMDQPGDWSERHNDLFNGFTSEHGNIRGHLSKSIEFIKSLEALNSNQPWYNEDLHESAEKELQKLAATLRDY